MLYEQSPACSESGPGFCTSGAELTQDPAIVIVTKPGEIVGEIPREIGGIAVEERLATPLELAEGLAPLSAWEGAMPEAVPQIGYRPPDPPLALEEKEVYNITCQVGSDSGWTTLKPFLEGTATSLTVAMYELCRAHNRHVGSPWRPRPPICGQTFAASGNPIRVKPLMSPDNYAQETLNLIHDAERTLYLQFSYIRQPSTEKFDEIITAIADKMNSGLDVRVLVGRNQTLEHSELLIGRCGWKRSMFRRQSSKLHNKGILIDGTIAVVGSNNWSSDGTQHNRDASLVFFSRSIAQYFTEVFLFDWDNLSKSISTAPEVEPVLAPESGPHSSGDGTYSLAGMV